MNQIACSTGIRSSKSLDDACAAMKALGFRYVDPLVIEAWHVKPSRLRADAEAEAEAVCTTLDKYDLKAIAINLGFVSNFTMCSDEEHALNLDVIRGACTLAHALETHIATVGPGGISGNEDRQAIVDRIVVRLNEAVEIAGARDVTLAVETHAGAIVVQPDASREMLDRVPGLTLTYDPSHYIAEEIAVEDTLDLIAHASHAHMRNARIGHFQETMAKGDLDIGWLIDQMMAAGYNGAISVEYIEDCGALKEGYDTVPEIEKLKAVLLEKGCML